MSDQDNPRDMAQLLLVFADALERRGAGVGGLGVLRRSAALLALLPEPSRGPICATCGVNLERSSRGRPRTYCSVPCRRRAEKERRNEVIGT